MFKLNPDPTFKAVVPITVPGGEPRAVTFIFKHRTRTGLAEWLRAQEGKADRELMGEFIVGWDGVLGDTGEAEPFNLDAVLRLVENYPAAAMEIYSGYIRALTESRAKN